MTNVKNVLLGDLQGTINLHEIQRTIKLIKKNPSLFFFILLNKIFNCQVNSNSNCNHRKQ